MQAHGITLSFHREMADASRELVAPDITGAVSFESYPRFIKGGFHDYEGLGIKRSAADSEHVPSPRSRLLGNNVFWSLAQKVGFEPQGRRELAIRRRLIEDQHFELK